MLLNKIKQYKLNKQKIKNLENDFNRGCSLYWFGRPTGDLRFYSWIRIKDIETIKKCVINGYEIKVDYTTNPNPFGGL